VVPYQYYAGIRSHLLSLMAANTVMSMVDMLTETDVPDARLFAVLVSWLQYLDRYEHATVLLIDAVVLKIFAALGLPPVLDRCVVCAKPWDSIGKELLAARTRPFSVGFSPGAGGLLCHVCAEQKKVLDTDVFFCGLTEMSALQLLMNDTWKVIVDFSLEVVEQQKLHSLVLEYARYHSEHAIVDWAKSMTM
jgi:recombinational DNA repair protein (RecF pathway)